MASVNGVSLQGHGRESVMRRMRDLASVARRLGFAAAAPSQWHRPTGGPATDAEEPPPPADAIPAGLFARPSARPRLCVLKFVDANANKRDLPAKTKERTKHSYENEYRCLRDLVPLLLEQSIYAPRVLACVEIKYTARSSLNRRVNLHAIDAAPARWRGGAGSSPLDAASAATSSCTRHTG